jgi:putative hemolysin
MLAVELSIIVVLVVVNGALAMSELAVVSSRPARRRAHGSRRCRGRPCLGARF